MWLSTHSILLRATRKYVLYSFTPSASHVSRRCYAITASRTYDDAVELLNTLQTPYKVLKERWNSRVKPDETSNQEMRKCLKLIGYSQQDLKKLNIIHVAGTKGKGSTCAYVDSILSQYRKSHDTPHNVGLFTSPHLIAVRERIRINSAPLSAPLFAKYFFDVWDRLEAAQTSPPFEKPVYFRYLTLMSYHSFIQEGVDAAIYEVGVGGEYDATNIVEHPAVTGISTLGIDHTFYLGETIDKIAWHKAGIQKQGVPSFTVKQIPAAMEVIKKRAEERKVQHLHAVEVNPLLEGVKIRPDAPFQKGNASLAVELAETVLGKLDEMFIPSRYSLPKEFVDGLEQVIWRGRCEMKVEGDITWYLDGAHTADSIVVAAKWFGDESANKSGTRVLIFNQQGHRESVELLEGLFNAVTSQGVVKFDHVIFCPTVPVDKRNKDHINLSTDSTAIASLLMQKTFAEKWKELDPSSATVVNVLPSVEDAFEYVRNLSGGVPGEGMDGKKVHAFITGSVHLVGRALGALEGVDAL